MSPNERIPLLCGYVFAVLAVVGVAGIFLTAASTGAVVLFVAGLVGVVAATASLVQAEQGAQRPASRPG